MTRAPVVALPLIALSSLVSVAFGTLFYSFSVLITEEAAGSVFSTSALSVAWSGSIVVGGGLAYLIGRRIDRHGVRGIMTAGSVLGAAGLALVGAAAEPWQVIGASWLLVGPAGAMTFYEPAFVAVDRWFGDAGRLRSIAVLTVVGGLAGPVFLPVTSLLVEALGWRWAAAVLGGILLVTGAAAPLGFRRDETPRARDVVAVRVRHLIVDPRFTRFTAASVLTFAAMQAVLLHRIAVFEESGFAITTVALWAAAAGLLSLPGRYAAPVLSDRARPVRLNAAANVALAIAVGLAISATAAWQMAGHFVIFGLAFGALLPLRAVVMGSWYSGPGYGSVMGLQWSIVATSAALGPLAVGVGRDAAGSYGIPLAFVAAGLLAAAFLGMLAEAPRS